MAFAKKIFQDGNDFTPNDANFIQTQYDEAESIMNDIQADFALSLFNETLQGDGSKNVYLLQNTLISQPVIVVKRLADSNYKAESVSLNTDGQNTQWKYTLNSNSLTQNNILSTKLLAGEFVRVGYILKMVPHASTHSSNGTDPININDLNGLTQSQIVDLIEAKAMGIDTATATQIASNVKKDSNVAAVCRSTPLVLLQPGEIAIII
jgi:hypothetical protein